MDLIGRKAEQQKILSALASQDPELVAIWGRRRVGKTFLVRYGRAPVQDYYLEVTGQRAAARKIQLAHFVSSLSKALHHGITLAVPGTWEEAFGLLTASLDSLPADGKPVTLFFDEAPWLDARSSGFLEALEYFWNTTGVKNQRLKVFVCGSAASWIINKIVNGRGGWHRRVTRRVLVRPFKLEEVAQYLASRQVQLSRQDVLKLYMVLGGVPHYLSLMQRGESVAAFVDRLFFAESPDLDREFDEVFDSLFNNSSIHKNIVLCLARSKAGLTRNEIAAAAEVPSGGSLSRYIDNLEQSGFIETHQPLGTAAERDKRYRVCDMFTLFHLSWLGAKARLRSWQAITASQRYHSWCGHAFEILCWNHAGSLAHALGIARSDYSVTRANLDNEGGQAQLDLMIDVRGGAVYLFELKFSDSPYVLNAAEAEKLLNRRRILVLEYKGARSIIVCLLASLGSQENQHRRDAVDLALDSGALLHEGG
jgi:uncharacterized protein